MSQSIPKRLSAPEEPRTSAKPLAETLLDGTGIAALADILAGLNRLHIDMRNAIDGASKESVANGDARDCATASRRRFEHVEAVAYSRADAIAELIFQTEPTSLDEVLTLLLIFHDRLDTFAGNYCNTAQDEASRDFRKLRWAVTAMVRGLRAVGATSPLLDYCTTAADLEMWAEARAAAIREGNRYRMAYDPAAGRLVTEGGR